MIYRRFTTSGLARWPASVPTRVTIMLACLACLAVCGGCGREIKRSYGQRSAPAESDSVNGTAVFADMFIQADHDVLSWRSLSPRLFNRADCIVWFPDDFDPPSDDTMEWLEDWLYDKPGRTLIYVGRDFDASSWYWDKIADDVPEEHRDEFNLRRAADKSDFLLMRNNSSEPAECPWFTAEAEYEPRKVTELGGQQWWLEDIDPSKLEIELNGRLRSSEYAEVVLHSKGDMLVSVEQFKDSQLIVVTNGSFLLNLSLVNQEHRKLAGKLIDAVGPSGQKVVFLESGPGGPPIHEKDPSPDVRTGMEIFNVWPTNWILLHLAIVGIIFCFSRAPIFGIPRNTASQGTSDFGKHVEAVGELLERSGDEQYALARLEQYERVVGSE